VRNPDWEEQVGEGREKERNVRRCGDAGYYTGNLVQGWGGKGRGRVGKRLRCRIHGSGETRPKTARGEKNLAYGEKTSQAKKKKRNA